MECSPPQSLKNAQQLKHNAQMRQWYASNRLRWRAYVAAWRAAHPDEYQASRRRYYQTHKERLRAKALAAYHKKKQSDLDVRTDL